MASILGIDISLYDNSPDFSKVKNAVSFVIAKATQGLDIVDPQFKRNQSELRKYDIPRGYYHFPRPDLGNTPEAEADFFLNTVGTLQHGELLALDAESYKDKTYSGDWVDWSYKFLKRIESKLGYKPLLYINLNFNNIYNWKKIVDNNNGLWLALFDNNPDYKPSTDWPFIAIKQYGGVTVNGVTRNGKTDGDIFYNDVNTFKKYGYQPFSVGSIVKFTKRGKLYHKSGEHWGYAEIGSVGKIMSIGEIKDGYQYYELGFHNVANVMVAFGGNFELSSGELTNTDGTSTSPEDPSEEEKLRKQVVDLTAELAEANTAKNSAERDLKVANEELDTLRDSIADDTVLIEKLKDDYRKSEDDRIEAVKQLNEYKNSNIGKLVVSLSEFWKNNKDFVKQLLEKLSKK